MTSLYPNFETASSQQIHITGIKYLWKFHELAWKIVLRSEELLTLIKPQVKVFSYIFEVYTHEDTRFSSVQLSHSVVSNFLWPHVCVQHARPPCPSPTLRVHPNPCPLSWWCHPTISSCVVPFSSHPQSFPASESFPISQLSASGGQSIGVSASTSVPPVNTQDCSPLGFRA